MSTKTSGSGRARASYHSASMLMKLPRITYEAFVRQYTKSEVSQRPNSFINAHADHAHEYTHFMQLTGTAFGQFETTWRVYQIGLLPEIVRAIGDAPRGAWSVRPYLPLKNWFFQCPDIGDVVSGEAYSKIQRWASTETVLSVLRGDVDVGDRERKACVELTGVEPDEQPTVECRRGHRHPLGATAIMEACAELSEYHAKMSMRPTGVVWENIEDILVSSGGVAGDITFEGTKFPWSSFSYIPNVDCSALLVLDLMAERLKHLSMVQRILLLPVICDLALAAPGTLSFRELVHRNGTWKDIHPGCRFLSILDYLRSIPKGDHRLKDHGVFARLVQDLCDNYNWVTPAGLAVQINREVFLNFHGYFFKKAAEVRMDHPFGFLHPYAEPEEFSVQAALGVVPHILFQDEHVAFQLPGAPSNIKEELRTLMLIEAFHDSVVRNSDARCALKALKFPCGHSQHQHCDDCLRMTDAPMCDKANEKYSKQMGNNWTWIQSPC